MGTKFFIIARFLPLKFGHHYLDPWSLVGELLSKVPTPDVLVLSTTTPDLLVLR